MVNGLRLDSTTFAYVGDDGLDGSADAGVVGVNAHVEMFSNFSTGFSVPADVSGACCPGWGDDEVLDDAGSANESSVWLSPASSCRMGEETGEDGAVTEG